MVLPFTTKLFLTVVLPAVLPIFNWVASPPKLIVVAVVFAKLNVVLPTVRLLATIFKLFWTFVIPVLAPILTFVPLAAILTFAGEANKLNVDCEVVKSPPLTATSPDATMLLAYIFPNTKLP